MISIIRNLLMFTASAVVIGYIAVWALSEYKLSNVDVPAPWSYSIVRDDTALDHGRHIARTRGCFGCHGQQLEGRVFTDQWPWVKRAVAPNLAAFAKQHSSEVLEASIRHGVGYSGKALWSMPSYNWVHLRDIDLASLIAFLQAAPIVEKSLPDPELGFQARWDMLLGREQNMVEWVAKESSLKYETSANSLLKNGEYLAKTTCNECHGTDLTGMYQAPSLAIIAAYNKTQFRQLMKTGTSQDGRTDLGLMTMVAKDRFAHFSDTEIDQLYAYLNQVIAAQ
ncbi:cytochrome c [Aliiglaciecola sp. M165]|uniref:c-type cytochrome n=1 Tax=Aliiglaciecola sp. M165 TaxID=2593649 RepID=UPI00163DC717|nr:cytochrome c [Aliiglaciecola sp. M165]